MTGIKMCGLSRPEDIKAANEIKPDYIGFVFYPKSRRCVNDEKAAELKSMLSKEIKAVGVFVDEDRDHILRLLSRGTIDMVQLHGSEDETYIKELKMKTDAPVIKAFVIKSEDDIRKAKESSADYVMLDSGTGSGSAFDWQLIKNIGRPYFLAGGLSAENAAGAAAKLKPFALDVSSGIETDGIKDRKKMEGFASAVRKEELQNG